MKGVTNTRAHDDMIEVLAVAPNISTFHPSDEAKARFWELVERSKSREITPDEKNELEQYNQLEHLMRLAKARAKQKNAARARPIFPSLFGVKL
jgi:hypothetical protein